MESWTHSSDFWDICALYFPFLMMIPLKLFGLRLPEVCGEWPMSLMGSCTLRETTCKAILFPRN